MKNVLFSMILLIGVNATLYAEQGEEGTSSVKQSLKQRVEDAINNGSNKYNFPMGMMPAGMVSREDAKILAEYIVGGMVGEQPASFTSCGSCHGADGKGNNGMAPDFTYYTGIISEYKKACEAGDADKCYEVGQIYRFGKGVKRDDFKTAKFYKKACNGGNARGCVSLGSLYSYGYGVRQSYAEEKEYYGKACDLGDAQGCKLYAEMNKY